MNVVGSWFRYEFRNRWRSLLALALLIAFAGATIMVAVAGARRGTTALDRLNARTLPATIVVLPNQPGFDWNRIRALPDVEALTTFVVGGPSLEDLGQAAEDEGIGGFAPGDDEVFRTIERPVMLAGRLPDPIRADEIVATPRFRAYFHKGVGDTLTLKLMTPEQVDGEMRGEDIGPPAGPSIRATIVGVGRSPWASDSPDNRFGSISAGAGLLKHYEANLLGNERQNYINALVRLGDGKAGIPAFKERLAAATGRQDIDVWDRSEFNAHVSHVTGFEANNLFAFALAAAAASLLLIGQAVARYCQGTQVDLDVFRSLGLGSRPGRIITAVAPTAAAVVGIALAVPAAVIASRWFPIATASLVEPNPGIDVDWTVLVCGLVVVPLLVAMGALVTAGVRARQARAIPSAAVAAVTSVGPVPVAIGARFALHGGRGRQSLPARPALVAALVGVAGVVGVLTFSAGASDAAGNVARFGQTYQLATFFGFNGEDFQPSRDGLEKVAADKDVRGTDDARMDVAQGNDVAVSLYTFDPVGSPIDVLVTKGRMPSVDGEVALAPKTASAMHVKVGDTVELTGSKGKVPARVTGLAFVPSGPHNEYADGGWALRATYDRLFSGYKFHFGLVKLAKGADATAVSERLQEATGIEFGPGPITRPTQQAELRQVRALPFFFAGFLALLALGAVAHTLVSTVRRRRRDLAVLRAIGMSRRGTRAIVLTQATIIGIVGFAIGAPVGVALGRTVWRVVANNTPVQLVMPTAWIAVLLAAPVALAAANLLAVWPSHRATTLRLGEALRTE